MNWFARSASSVSSQNVSCDIAADGDSSSVTMSREEMFGIGPEAFPVRQLSMRRARPSVEIDKELGDGSPSITPRNITPLTPLTPLRWKSSPREQEEEEKAMERSRLGMSRDEENPRSKLAAGNGKEDRAIEGQDQVAGVGAHVATNSAEKLSTEVQAGNVDDSVSLEPSEDLDRKGSSGDDGNAMTIEFLRARLTSERSASKAAKLRVQQLASKGLFELSPELASLSALSHNCRYLNWNKKLNQAVADRTKAEVASQEAFMKLKLAESCNQALDRASAEVSDRSISGSPLLRSRAGREDTKQEVSSNEDLSRTNSYGSSVEDRDSTTKKQLPETVSKVEGLSTEQGRPQSQDSRTAIESRLRNMWSKISEEMAAFAEERNEKDVVREELMSWMGQVPSVLQVDMPKKVVVPLTSETESTEPNLVETRQERSQRILSGNGQPRATAKRGALLREQFAAQESIPQERERSQRDSLGKLEQFKEDDRNANRSQRSPGGLLHADHMHGRNGVADHSSCFGTSHARLAKSKSSLDLPTRPREHISDVSVPDPDVPYVESDSWNTEIPLKQGACSRRRDPVYQNARAEMPMLLEANHRNHSRMQQELSSEPSMLHDAERETWSERQSDQDSGLYYQDIGNGAGLPSYAERGPSEWRPPNRSGEDGFRRSQPEFGPAQSTWDDGDRRNSGRHQHAQLGDKDSDREESYRSSQRETSHPLRDRRRLRRSLSDNDNWPSVDDCGALDQQPEPSIRLERRQSYSGYSATMASDSSRPSVDKVPSAYGDVRYRDGRMYEAHGLRRDSFPSSKADRGSGQYFTEADRNDFNGGESPLSLGYGPAFDAPKEGSPRQSSPNAGMNKNVSDVLRALQIAKANIQNGGAGAKEPRLNLEPASQATGFGMDPSAQYVQTSRQGMTEQVSQAPLSKPSRSASRNGKYDPYEADSGTDRYQSQRDPAGGISANTGYVDQLNVGKGIEFFFP